MKKVKIDKVTGLAILVRMKGEIFQIKIQSKNMDTILKSVQFIENGNLEILQKVWDIDFEDIPEENEQNKKESKNE